MRRNILIGGAAMLVLGGVGYAIVSSFLAPTVWARDTMRDSGMFAADLGANGGSGTIADQLQLTQAQRGQIKSIVAGEAPNVAPLLQELGSAAKQVQALTNNGAADPTQVHALIDREQPVLADLIVEGVRAKTQIYNTVLTPDQQKQAQSMMAAIGPRMDDHIDKLPSMAGRLVSLAAWRLNLTDDQQTRIRSLIDAGVQKDLPLVKQLASDREAMLNVTGGGRFDETDVRRVADSTATTATALADDAALLKSQVFAVLTPYQRDKVIQFQQQRRDQRRARLRFWTGA